jgi:hypothetical protein
MRIEVNDEAARLRRREMPIKCGGEPEAGVLSHQSQQAPPEPRSSTARECDDCCNEHVSCRCNPGEG